MYKIISVPAPRPSSPASGLPYTNKLFCIILYFYSVPLRKISATRLRCVLSGLSFGRHRLKINQVLYDHFGPRSVLVGLPTFHSAILGLAGDLFGT